MYKWTRRGEGEGKREREGERKRKREEERVFPFSLHFMNETPGSTVPIHVREMLTEFFL